jgi:hypothetical protein
MVTRKISGLRVFPAGSIRRIADAFVPHLCENCLAVNQGRQPGRQPGAWSPESKTTEGKMLRKRMKFALISSVGLIPWLVAVAITAVAVMALAEGYFA